jgi:hypothetical protein
MEWPMTQAPESREEAQPSNDPIVERVVMPFVRESTLWPVLIVLVAHVALAIAMALLLALRDRRIASMAALAGLVGLTVAAVSKELRRGRPGVLCGLLLASWLLGAALATVADHYGVF